MASREAVTRPDSHAPGEFPADADHGPRARDAGDVEREVLQSMAHAQAQAADDARAQRLAQLTSRLDHAISRNQTTRAREIRRRIAEELAHRDEPSPEHSDSVPRDVALGRLNPFEERRGQAAKVSRATDDELEWVEIHGGLRLPAQMYDKLFDYQQTGLRWLWELHTQCCGGIVGDEMGLGKTVQVIAFLTALVLSRKFDDGTGVIVVAPATVLNQWRREFHQWAGPYNCFHVSVIHSADAATSSATHDADALRRHLREVLAPADTHSSNGNSHVDAANAPPVPVGVIVTSYEHFRRQCGILAPLPWEYVVLDEGHKIRNPDAAITKACKSVSTPRRLILSGSPLQNSLRELWSLFDFVFPAKLGTLDVFETQFGAPISMGGYSSASPSQVRTAYQCALALQSLISPYILRRMKKDVAMQLPSKSEQVLFCKLAVGRQLTMYKEFLGSRHVREVLNGRGNALGAISILRQICNHPDLRGSPETLPNEDGDEEDRVRSAPEDVEELWAASGKMVVLQQVLTSWRTQGHRVLLFSQSVQMLNILETFVQSRGYSYRRMDGGTPVKRRTSLIDEFNTDSELYIFLLSTRVGGLGVNLTGANRVVIYDPDWNPAHDLQARERAWRVGQTRQVTIYRLITSGTIEEKIYHRQIYKQFLGHKVLTDAKQRQFFKPKHLEDLFSYIDADDRTGTETGEMFGALGADDRLALDQGPHEAHSPDKGQNVHSREDSTSATIPGPSSEADSDILRSLLGDKSILSTMNHDQIVGPSSERLDARAIEMEASEVAKKAVDALKRSRVQLDGGDPSAFNTSKSLRVKAGSASKGLLDRIRAHRQNFSEDTGEHTDLARRLVQYLERRGGEASTQALVSHFENDIAPRKDGIAVFKEILKGVASLSKTAPGGRGTRTWNLKMEHRDVT